MRTRRTPAQRIWEGVQHALLASSMLVVVLPILLIVWFVIDRGLPALNWEFLTQPPRDQMTAGGIMPVIVGTLYLMLGTLLFALPLGVFGAIYITEYGRSSFLTRLLRLAIVNLAGVPSVVYGLFGLGFFVLAVGGGIDRVFFHSPRIAREDLADVPALVTRLREKSTPFAAYLAEYLSPATRDAMSSYRVEEEDEGRIKAQNKRLAPLLAEDLNLLLERTDFYTAERFEGVFLGPDLEKLAVTQVTGDALLRKNRQLLEKGLEGELASFRRLVYGTGALVWAALTLTLMILPVVITAAEEALLSVPEAFRQASLGLGCTKWQTIWNVVLPNALPGILTGLILGLSRAAGETAPILLTGAAFFLPTLPEGINSPFMALPYHLFIMSTQAADVPDQVPWGTALVLLLLVLGMNAVASFFRARARAGRRW